MLDRIKNAFYNSYTDDQVRKLVMFRMLNVVLGVIAFAMSVMNIFTNEIPLFFITAAYTVLCFFNFILAKKNQLLVQILFSIETITMLSTFIVTGIPEGFSVLWTLIVPACTMAIFGKIGGSAFSTIMFGIIVTLFWCPWGQDFLQYPYSETFMLRFPMVYICMFLIAFYIEWIRRRLYDKLIETERKFQWLYQHDALTGLYSRHAFYEKSQITQSLMGDDAASILLFDIDNFKKINDHFGHNIGDIVLQHIASITEEITCEHCINCRWGGEEFVVMMRCEHDPLETAEKIRQGVEATYVNSPDGTPIRFTISVGVAAGVIHNNEQLTELINCADKAMYQSKEKGKNQITLYKENE